MEFRYDKHNKYHRLARSIVIAAISLTVMIWLWWMISIIADKPAIPTPYDTFVALIDLFKYGDPIHDVAISVYIEASLKKLVQGFFLALIVALPLGLIMGRFKVLREFFTPMIEVLRPIAPIAWAPIFFILFTGADGDTTWASSLVVFIGIVFPLMTNVMFGVTKIDPITLDAAKTLGASDLQIFLKVMLPSTVPYLMNGIKIGLGIGWMCIVASELYDGFNPGLGSYLSLMISNSSYAQAFAGIILISVLGLLTTGLAEYIHKKVNKRMGVDM